MNSTENEGRKLLSTTKDYDIFRDYDKELLVDSISALVAKGYVPAGNVQIIPISVPDENNSGKNVERYVYVQAVYLPHQVRLERSAKDKKNIVGKCPRCHEDMYFKPSGALKCTNKECKAEFYQVYGRTLTESEARDALSGKKVLIKDLKNQDGTKRDVLFSFTGGTKIRDNRIWLDYVIPEASGEQPF